jgi:GT2 family glycosyltransferase
VVVNYNGGPYVGRCLEHLLATDWPPEALELVVVDNASTDGSPEMLAERAAGRTPAVRIHRSPANLGFSGGNNVALRDRAGVDYVALVNNDAFVEPGWLRPLVEALEADPTLGAANAKILFEPAFAEVTLRTEAFVPDTADTRSLGVQVHGIETAGEDAMWKAKFVAGFHGAEPAFRWSSGEGTMWVPLPAGSEPPVPAAFRLAAEREKRVELIAGAGTAPVAVTVGAEPAWHEVKLTGPFFDVVNNAGSLMIEGVHGADRGFWARDDGRFDTPVETFAWCGNGVLLSGRYLDDVGLFDEAYFMYYEDFDLSWRGRARGWRYVCVPASVVRHRHASSLGESSATFDHFVQRNRLITLVKNAPAPFVARQLGAYLRDLARLTDGEVVRPALRRLPVRPHHSARRLRSLLAFAEHLPEALRQRRRLAAGRRVDGADLLRWAVPQDVWLRAIPPS